jgi:hypothetical protein
MLLASGVAVAVIVVAGRILVERIIAMLFSQAGGDRSDRLSASSVQSGCNARNTQGPAMLLMRPREAMAGLAFRCAVTGRGDGARSGG